MKTIILDFDGTIADSLKTAISIYHDVTHRQQPVTEEELRQVRHMHILRIAREEKIPGWRIPLLLVRGRQQMSRRLGEVTVIDGMAEAIQQLALNGYQLFVMSSNSTDNIQRFLRDHQLSEYFTRVYGGIGLRGKGAALKRTMRREHLAKQECLYVGDELRDIIGAREADIRCIAVGWGFNDAAMLLEQKPLAVVDSPAMLVRIIEDIEPQRS